MAVKWNSISRLHAFPRTEDHLTRKTHAGAAVTLLGIITILVLFIHELRFYMTHYIQYEMGVDKTSRSQKLGIVLNITFPRLPCEVLSLDALDMSGNHEVDLHANIYKERLDSNGRFLDRELVTDLVEGEHKLEHERPHAPANATALDIVHHGDALETTTSAISSIRKALTDQEGCLIHGHMVVQRVAGNFHISVHGHSFFVLQQVFTNVGEVDVSHHIGKLTFGKEYPGMESPLDGFDRSMSHGRSQGGTFKYFLKVVPTEYRHLDGQTVVTNQYSVTEYYTPIYPGDGALPAVYFLYDLSPITVAITEKRRNFFHFLTRLCAVLGGTFAVTGMLDRWVYHLIQQMTGGPARNSGMSPVRLQARSFSSPSRKPL